MTQGDITRGMDRTWNVSLKSKWEETDWTKKHSFKYSKVLCVCVCLEEGFWTNQWMSLKSVSSLFYFWCMSWPLCFLLGDTFSELSGSCELYTFYSLIQATLWKTKIILQENSLEQVIIHSFFFLELKIAKPYKYYLSGTDKVPDIAR